MPTAAKASPLGFFREFQADGIFAGAGHFRVQGGHAFRRFGAPVLIRPRAVRVHQVRQRAGGRRGFLGGGKAYAAQRQYQRQYQRQNG